MGGWWIWDGRGLNLVGGGGGDLNLVGGVVMVLPMRDGGRVPWETPHHYDH